MSKFDGVLLLFYNLSNNNFGYLKAYIYIGKNIHREYRLEYMTMWIFSVKFNVIFNVKFNDIFNVKLWMEK